MSNIEAGHKMREPSELELRLLDRQVELFQDGITAPPSLVLLAENEKLRRGVAAQSRENLSSDELAGRIIGDVLALPARLVKDARQVLRFLILDL